MYCPACGIANPDSARRCHRCNQWLVPPPAHSATVPTHLVWAILTTLLCCMPVGIVSLIYASQVESKLAAGNYDGAVDSSTKARIWAIVAALLGGLATPAVVIVNVTMGGLVEFVRALVTGTAPFM